MSRALTEVLDANAKYSANFGSKAALFHEAVVVPFLQVVADLNTRWELFEPGPESSEALAREFLGALYDMFVENRGLVMTLWTADALTDEELAETGIVEIDQALALLGELGGKGADLLQIGRRPMEISARSTVAMVAGMAAFSSTFFGGQRPPRDEVVDELVQANLHGFLHRQARDSGVAGTATGDTHA